jgi:hypothetical protein
VCVCVCVCVCVWWCHLWFFSLIKRYLSIWWLYLFIPLRLVSRIVRYNDKWRKRELRIHRKQIDTMGSWIWVIFSFCLATYWLWFWAGNSFSSLYLSSHILDSIRCFLTLFISPSKLSLSVAGSHNTVLFLHSTFCHLKLHISVFYLFNFVFPSELQFMRTEGVFLFVFKNLFHSSLCILP